MRYAVLLVAALGGASFVAAPTPFPTSFGMPGGNAASSSPSESRLLLPLEERPERDDGASRARERVKPRNALRGSSRTRGKRGELRIVPGRSDALGEGRVVRFVVEVEGRVRADAPAFARMVERVLSDPRGWGAVRSFRRVDSEPFDLRIALASPALTDRLCAPLRTNRIFSCAAGNRAVLNLRRWRRGSDAYAKALARYRIYMINHEVGHVLGLGHAACPASRAKAPVMMQQTKGVAPCVPNAWPLPSERESRRATVP